MEIVVSLVTISQYITHSIKRIQIVAVAAITPELEERQRAYCLQFLHLQNRIVAGLKETGFQVSTRRLYGRSKRSVRALITVPNLRTKNITMIAAMSVVSVPG